jgi:hypothetical protein
MKGIFPDEYWSSQFDITQDDLKRIAERMERDGTSQELKATALRIIRGRMEHGHDLSPAALSELTGKASVRLWDPAGEWQVGDVVLVAHQTGNDSEGNPIHSAFIGEIRDIHENTASILIEKLGGIKYQLAGSGSENAKKWHETVCEAVEKKLQSTNLDEQAEGVLLKHGERILSRLASALEADVRFIGLEGKWYVKSKLPRINDDSRRAVHRNLLEKPSASIDELLSTITTGQAQDETLLRMAVNAALEEAPARFKNIGTASRPQWQARLPSPENALVTHYAYDLQTYQILCRRGQRLTSKQVQRLQELDLYTYVVTFAE